MNLKQMSQESEILSNGHRLCAGCAASIIIRQASHAVKDPLVVGCATGCLEVSTTIYPETAWNCSFIHNAFENSAATISGVEAAYQSLRRQGKIKQKQKFLAIGGDGGSYDIGFQSLSGAMERGHDMVFICYDNNAYMNTGTQRSSATPIGAATSTTPVGSVRPGKQEYRKDLTACMVAHAIPYVAQASPHRWQDLVRKVEEAFATPGPAFINVVSPCPRGWRFDPKDSIDQARGAVECCFWPLYEVRNGTEWTLNYKPKSKLPVAEWIKDQGRYRHIFKEENKALLGKLQGIIDSRWNELLKRCGEDQ